MNTPTHEQLNAWMDEWMDGWMDGQMDEWNGM